jgi:hypothetical protein
VVEAFLRDLLIQEQFVEGCLTIHVTENPSKGEEGTDFSAIDEEGFSKFV